MIPTRAEEMKTSPFGSTSGCRGCDRLSATIIAQKPVGRVSPALSGAQTGFATTGADRVS
jgi:hypothetical protein